MTHIYGGLTRIGAMLFLGLLTGCGEVTPEKIQEWKAQGTANKLVGSLNDSRQFIRIDSIAALKELKAQEAVEPLGNLLSDPDPVIVHKALEALAQIGGPDIEPYMLTAIKNKEEPARKTAATALGAGKFTSAVQPLIAAMSDEYESVVVAAATALGQFGDAQAIGALADKAQDPSYKVRFACITSLNQIGGDDTAEALTVAMGDVSENIRKLAIEGLITIGKPAVPYALDGLRSEGEFTRQTAVSVLKGTGAVPASGSDLVWYTLAGIPTVQKAKMDPAIVNTLAGIDDGTDTLLKAIAHPGYKVYDYAFHALEKIGEPAAAQAAGEAELNAGTEGKAWFSGRADWKGAPSWRLDLWGALTALNPQFELNPKAAKTLSNNDIEARSLLTSKQFKPTPEYVPLLIAQCQTLGETIKEGEEKDTGLNRSLAEKKLLGAGDNAVLPLIAALDDPDINIASSCAKILEKMDADGFQSHLIEAFSKKVNAGEEISGSDFFTLVTKLNNPAVDPLLIKVRPNDARAIQVFEKKYPDVRVSIVPMRYEIDSAIKAQPFRLKYLISGKSKELKVVFRPNEDGEWEPNPPLPDTLP